MQQCDETDGAVNPREIMIGQALVCWLIPHGGGLPAAQLFLRRMMVSSIGITDLLNVVIWSL